jgi:DnaK suppressor protein
MEIFMDQNTLENFKNLFQGLKKHHLMGEKALEALEESNKGDEVDLALEDRDRQLALKLQGRDNFFFRKVDAALERINDGTFGACLECSDDIGLDRLLARPTAHLCINCKEDQERVEEHVLYDKKSHTHGKELNSGNVVNLPMNSNEITQEKVLKFNRERINIGLKH